MFKFIKYLLIASLFLFSIEINAQKTIWAQKNNLDKKANFTKVIGQNKFGVYVLKHKNNSFRKYFVIEHFDKKMNLLASRTIKIPNAELQKIAVTPKGISYFTKYFNKDYTCNLQLTHLDSNWISDIPKTIFSGKKLAASDADFIIELDQEKQHFSAAYTIQLEDKTLINYSYYENEILIAKDTITLPYSYQNIVFSKSTLTHTGSLFTLFTVKNNSRNSVNNYRILGINFKQKHWINLLINDGETHITDYDMAFNPNYNTMQIAGFYGEKNTDENKGYFNIGINAENLKTLQSVFIPLDRKIVSTIIGLKYEQKGENLTKFFIKKIIPRIDGGSLIIAERIYVTTQSDIFYVNGVPQTSYARIFNNDEILMLNLDSTGKIIWNDVVVKNQSSVNDGGYYNGIIVMVNDNNINMIYNDKLSANADIIQVTYNAKGEHTKKILLNSDQFYALVIPSEYSQVSANSIVIPVNQNRDNTYIKLLY